MIASQRGIALVLVLWLVALLSLMAGAFTLTTRRETAAIALLRDQARAQAAAEAGVYWAELMLLADESERWQTDGRRYRLNLAEATLTIRLFAESGKVDLNQTEEAQLAQLLTILETDLTTQQALTSAILDWRDSDDQVRVNGAELEDYLAAGLLQGPGNRPFASIRELLLVKGVDRQIFLRLSPFVTVYSGRQQINAETASPELTALLGLPANIPPPAVAPTANSFLDFARAALANRQPQQTATLIAVQALLPEGGGATLGAVVKPASTQTQGQTLPFEVLAWRVDADQDQALFLPVDAMDESGYPY